MGSVGRCPLYPQKRTSSVYEHTPYLERRAKKKPQHSAEAEVGYGINNRRTYCARHLVIDHGIGVIAHGTGVIDNALQSITGVIAYAVRVSGLRYRSSMASSPA
jgi:hypothetical protein